MVGRGGDNTCANSPFRSEQFLMKLCGAHVHAALSTLILFFVLCIFDQAELTIQQVYDTWIYNFVRNVVSVALCGQYPTSD